MSEETKPFSAAEIPGFEDLSPREQAFVLHPEAWTNTPKAMIDAGYSPAYANHKASAMRSRLMRFLRPVLQKRFEGFQVDASFVQQRLAAVADLDITDFQERLDVQNEDGTWQTVVVWRDPKSLPKELRRVIKSVEYTTITDAKGNTWQSDRPAHIAFYDALKAQSELAKVFSDVPLKNPLEEEADLLEHLSPEERELIGRLYSKAIKRKTQPALEGMHVERSSVRQIAAPSNQGGRVEREQRSLGGEGAGDQSDDTPVPARIRGVGPARAKPEAETPGGKARRRRGAPPEAAGPSPGGGEEGSGSAFVPRRLRDVRLDRGSELDLGGSELDDAEEDEGR